jgi:predicted RNA binding protein YcfA (HicA-like mRNA interferase family)
MRAVSGKELAQMLERHGWKLARVQGSHHIYSKAECNVRLSVPMHGKKALKLGLLKHLLKMA